MSPDQVGQIRGEFRPGSENLFAGIVIGLLLIGGGAGLVWLPTDGVIASKGDLPVWTEKGWCWGAVAIFAAIGVGLIVGGFYLIRFVRYLFSLRVRVGENGLSITDHESTRFFAWKNIVYVQETHLYERPPILTDMAKYVLPKVLSKSFVIEMNDGESFKFDGNMQGHLKLARLIKEETDRRKLPWQIVEEQGY